MKKKKKISKVVYTCAIMSHIRAQVPKKQTNDDKPGADDVPLLLFERRDCVLFYCCA